MKIRNFEPHSLDWQIQQRNRQTLGALNLTHVGRTTLANSTPIADSAAAEAFDVNYTIERRLLEYGGATRIYAAGVLSTTTGATLAMELRIGGVAAATIGPVTLPDGLVNAAWVLEAMITCRAAGATGEVVVHATFRCDSATGSGGTAAPVTVDTGADQLIEVAAQWNNADAGNTAMLQTLVPEHL